MEINHGSFIISLDFELIWGVLDKRSIASYGANILGAKEAIISIVDLFTKYNVKATIATVGLLFCQSKNEIYKFIPSKKPGYTNKNLSPFENNYLDKIMNENDPYHSATELLLQLKNNRNIEIATHTFSHYYCGEKGQTIEEFEADIQSAIKIANDNGVKLKSIVFPRNQVSKPYLKVCLANNITIYRGNPKNFFENGNKLKNKILRFLDSYLPIINDTTYPYSDIKENGMFNVKASRFLRPYSKKIGILNNLKIERIKKEMTQAAKQHTVYHLWWHPHNFGINQKENIKTLEKILRHYKILSKKYGFKSFTMSELSDLLNV